MWLYKYPRAIQITYDQGKYYIVRKFRKSLIEDEYRITAKPSTSGNLMSNAILERIHQVLVNQVRTFNVQQTYVDKNYPRTGILFAAAFTFSLTTISQRAYSLGKLIFGQDMILLIKHRVDWELIC